MAAWIMFGGLQVDYTFLRRYRLGTSFMPPQKVTDSHFGEDPSWSRVQHSGALRRLSKDVLTDLHFWYRICRYSREDVVETDFDLPSKRFSLMLSCGSSGVHKDSGVNVADLAIIIGPQT